jgi:hypothetical protein
MPGRAPSAGYQVRTSEAILKRYGVFPPEDWEDALPHILAEITATINPERRNRSCPRAVNRARHNNYRIKKPDEHASTRHDGPPTIHIHALTPRAA